MNVDLHTHTTVSDGKLTPADLVQQALTAGVEIFSITDHDTCAAYQQLKSLDTSSLTLIPGVEFSSEWRKVGIHILGLNVRLDSDVLQAGIARQTQARSTRAQCIAERLDKLGIKGSWEAVQKIAGDSVIGRPHFSQFLVESGVVKDIKQAFSKYLGAGKPGDVKHFWATFDEVIHWIREAGGTAVLAHPDKYKLTRSKLLVLLDEFRRAGGEGMEVISGKQTADVTRQLARICQQQDMLASCGSDFHQPGQPWSELGRVTPLPDGCKAVWENWS